MIAGKRITLVISIQGQPANMGQCGSFRLRWDTPAVKTDRPEGIIIHTFHLQLTLHHSIVFYIH